MNLGMKWFRARKLVFVGGILVALSAILSSLASELMVMICLQSVLLGEFSLPDTSLLSDTAIS